MKTAEALQRAVDYIEEHLCGELSLHDAAGGKGIGNRGRKGH